MLLVKTKIDVSPIQGIGLFADEYIPKGTVIWKFNKVIDLRFDEKQFSNLAESALEQIKKYSYREIHSGLYVLCGDDARFLNHSSNPNCLDVYYNDEEDLTLAQRDIAPGEELTSDYLLFDLDLILGKYELPVAEKSPATVEYA